MAPDQRVNSERVAAGLSKGPKGSHTVDSSQKPSSDRTEPTKTGVKTSLGGTSQDADGERSGPPHAEWC